MKKTSSFTSSCGYVLHGSGSLETKREYWREAKRKQKKMKCGIPEDSTGIQKDSFGIPVEQQRKVDGIPSTREENIREENIREENKREELNTLSRGQGKIPDWAEYSGSLEKKRTQTAERVRRYREKKQSSCNVDVTRM